MKLNYFILILSSTLLISFSAKAGMKGLTIHSRANCGNNESITWQFGTNHWLRTVSVHTQYKTISSPPPNSMLTPGISVLESIFGKREHRSKTHHRGRGVESVQSHKVDTGEQETWRSAAVHFGEAHPGSGWVVTGKHWKKNNQGQMQLIGTTKANDCSIYDGWWDWNTPGTGT